MTPVLPDLAVDVVEPTELGATAVLVPVSNVNGAEGEVTALRSAGLIEDGGERKKEAESIFAMETVTATSTVVGAGTAVSGKWESDSLSLARVSTMGISYWKGFQGSGGGGAPTLDASKDTGATKQSVGGEEGGRSSLRRASTLRLFPQEAILGGAETLPCISEEPQPVQATAAAPVAEQANSFVQQDGTERQESPGPLGGSSLVNFVQKQWTRGDIKKWFLANVAEASGASTAAVAKEALNTNGGSKLIIGRNIGQGTFGRIDVVTRTGSPAQFALKTLKLVNNTHATIFAAVEMVVFASVARNPHKNLLCAAAVDDSSTLMPILLPIADYDMETVLLENPSLLDRLRLVLGLAEGAQHLHSIGFVHRDIKPGNVLVFGSGEPGFHAELADFGFAAAINEQCPALMGTAGYMGMECFINQTLKASPAQDVFAVAMVFVMACLKPEHRHQNLFTSDELRLPHESARLNNLGARAHQGEDVGEEMTRLQFEVTKRTMEDGSFFKWLSTDKFDSAVPSPEMVISCLKDGPLANDPGQREDMNHLRDLVTFLIR